LFYDDHKALYVVTQEQPGIYEIKNIVTVPKYQRKGYGQKLISFIVNYYKQSGSELYVRTGDSPMTLNFYEKCRFKNRTLLKTFL
jgi:GNAT superfamily N-acetyltransferase